METEMETETIVGIDPGTTNSEVAIISGGGPQVVLERDEAILPSCVGLDEAGNVVVGHQARNGAAPAPRPATSPTAPAHSTDRPMP